MLLDGIDINADGKVDRKELRLALQKLGYKVNDMEADELFDVVDVSRSVLRAFLSFT